MSGLTDVRLAYLRYTTKNYIKDNPTDVILSRQTPVEQTGGGHKFPKAAVPVQTFRFIDHDITSGIFYGSDDGIARRFTYVMIGPYDADIDINDTWTVGEISYKIESLMPNNGWESRAYVTAYTKEPVMG
jgi:hypothetical protein